MDITFLKHAVRYREKVKQAVESMTGLSVKHVNIYISGVAVEKE